MRSRRAVLSNSLAGLHQLHWSYLSTGILPGLKSFVSHSCENCRGVPSFFPFWFAPSFEGLAPLAPSCERSFDGFTKTFDGKQLASDTSVPPSLLWPSVISVLKTRMVQPSTSSLESTHPSQATSVHSKALILPPSRLESTFTKSRGRDLLPALHRFPNWRRAVIPFPSVTVTVAPAATSVSRSTCPLGQRISMLSALSCCPRPKVSTNSLAEM
jgi:hypothetical protein